jgi:hypothetical protein
MPTEHVFDIVDAVTHLLPAADTGPDPEVLARTARTSGTGFEAERSTRAPSHMEAMCRLAMQAEGDIGRMRVVQVQAIRAIGLATDGDRSPEQLEWWTVDQLGLTPTTAHDLVFAARSMSDDRLDEVRSGAVTFDRALAETRALVAGADDGHVRGSRRPVPTRWRVRTPSVSHSSSAPPDPTAA